MTKNLTQIVKFEKKLFDILFLGSLIILYGLALYFLYTFQSYYIIIELIFAPLILFVIFNFVLKEKVFFKNTRKTAKVYFDILGNEKIVFRYSNLLHYRRSSFRIFLLSLILFGGLFLLNEFVIDYSESTEEDKAQNRLIIIGAMFIPSIPLYGFHTTKNSFTLNNDFEFYYSRACFSVLANDRNIVDTYKLKLIINGLKSYNNYLRLEVGYHLQNLERLFLNVIGDSNESMNDSINEINQILEHNDRLELLFFITKIIGKENTNLIQAHISQKAKEWIPILLGPIAVIIALIQIF